ncbi:MAG: CAF17-like 4Fe-4S cluster assembly/insertion protein YgfZ [Gemmatimonadales bacterium]
MQLDFSITASQLNTLRSGAAVSPDRTAILRIEGPGALDCLQGLLTCDIVAPGDNRLIYGAVLTGKGMIIFDSFVVRENGRVTLVLPDFVREAALAHLGRTLPPRLARLTDLTGDHDVVWFLGNESLARIPDLTRDVPELEPAMVVSLEADHALLAVGTGLMPFAGLVIGPAAEARRFVAKAQADGMEVGDGSWLAAARVLAGWPTLGREIDEKTFPQEVRYDELGAVSYTKGCYTGQETVARVHFRGHPNRALRGLIIEGGAEGPSAERRVTSLESRVLRHSGKDAGVLRTAIHLENRMLALATMRREVADDAELTLGDRSGHLTPLPFTAEVTV